MLECFSVTTSCGNRIQSSGGDGDIGWCRKTFRDCLPFLMSVNGFVDFSWPETRQRVVVLVEDMLEGSDNVWWGNG